MPSPNDWCFQINGFKYERKSRWFTYNPPTYDPPHFKKANLIFCDGHVKYRKYYALRSGDFGLVPDWAYEPTTQNYTGQTSAGFTAAF